MQVSVSDSSLPSKLCPTPPELDIITVELISIKKHITIAICNVYIRG